MMTNEEIHEALLNAATRFQEVTRKLEQQMVTARLTYNGEVFDIRKQCPHREKKQFSAFLGPAYQTCALCGEKFIEPVKEECS